MRAAVAPSLLIVLFGLLPLVLAASAAGVRRSAIAGSWYPGSPSLAAAEVTRMLRAAAAESPAPAGKPVALVVPHAGWRYSGRAAAAAFRTVQRGDFTRVVVVAPSHHSGFTGFALSEASAYRTPLGDIPLDREAIAALTDPRLARPVPGAEDEEHAVEIELPFLQQALGTFTLVPILAGNTTPEQDRAFAAKLATLHDGKTLFVFSSDFTHSGPRFGYAPFGRSAPAARAKIQELQDTAVARLARLDAEGFRRHLDITDDTICGRHGLSTMTELLRTIAPRAQGVLLAQYASIDLPELADDNSVSYVAMAFYDPPVAAPPKPAGVPAPAPAASAAAPPLDADLSARLVRLARAAINTELRGTDEVERELAALPPRPELDRMQGVFVTLSRTDPREIAQAGKLRGCIGQVLPAYPLLEAVVVAAVSAALEDPRFTPVTADELDRLAVEVTVLSAPRPVASWKEIKLGTHGILLDQNGRRAVFLPQVPGEQGWTLEETLDHLSRKAGLGGSAWRDPSTKFSVFTGQVIEEAGHSRPAAR